MDLQDFDDQVQEKTLESKRIFDGKVISLDLLTVRLPNGREATREVVKHPGAVAVLAVTEEGKIVFVRQYRKAIERVSLEIPAGKLEPGEDPFEAAQRELQEETGYRAQEWQHLHSFFTSPGFADEIMHVYVAKQLEKTQANPDDDEFLQVLEADAVQILLWLQQQAIIDAKTLVPLYWWLWQQRGV
ncbi:NUDIX hydrolase [Fodinisporobacter ferrooxydans]|uniref:NUDIX hydrolase n=2 Tax=Fodinisporobacter ferrooxydans TaxID=2901836 RepID=A0ABY4CTD9_9BACL|nr:NUDIX hydrolase [Alicyclobacillaceae bacterium MYW30-H2]